MIYIDNPLAKFFKRKEVTVAPTRKRARKAINQQQSGQKACKKFLQGPEEDSPEALEGWPAVTLNSCLNPTDAKSSSAGNQPTHRGGNQAAPIGTAAGGSGDSVPGMAIGTAEGGSGDSVPAGMAIGTAEGGSSDGVPGMAIGTAEGGSGDSVPGMAIGQRRTLLL
ncbi:hypothetical protein VOLCADRAFT_73646 [Volvox carteri f. nagariensis]|uniref:Uncharacterized protein n=1 Tax=Volvox carteri f. nagariensis TaxID=3068 RepID=D8TP64_VOLCA|nr:uncharacterized protein VOLCADRAFT_73646 [Volvox carteri f. nagariensis]EFJ50566.1 hypothetical protein VOLCADRAFT_73646 [Volvox carteri f. nagariensis]|eukprot:XP_002948159.1 hypothetical protein VOLCADRAFT_73646 [Volvox carteri f. nagariensis]